MSDVREYKCPSCGAPMQFDIEAQCMVCSFCAGRYDLDYIRSHFNEVTDEKLSDFDWVERTKYVWEPDVLEQLAEYTCSSCGGNIITKNIISSARCPFCGHDVVISSNFDGDLRPDRVIPFSRSAEEFAEKYRERIASAEYAPKEFSDPSVTDRIVGCYVPIWLYSFNCGTDVGTRGKVDFRIKDYPILGTDIKRDIFYSVAPFMYEDSEPFTESCLTGYFASRYSIGAEHAMEKADEEALGVCSARAASIVGGDYIPGQMKTKSSVSHKELTYFLVPVWFLNVAYKGVDYTFAMNGQTGEFASPKVPLNYKSKLHFFMLFAFLEVLTLILSFMWLKMDSISVLGAIGITLFFVIFFATTPVFIVSMILHHFLSKKKVGGLKQGSEPNVASIAGFITQVR